MPRPDLEPDMQANTDITLAGEIVSWEIPNGTRVPHAHLKAALKAGGLDESLSRDMQPRNAFARAAGTLADQRIIRRLSDDTSFMRFQFTREEAAGEGDAKRLNYNYEAVVTLNKRTGEVLCDECPPLAAEAERLLKEEMDARKTSDITRILFMLFADGADIFSVRSQGGCYFVPAKFQPFLEQVETFLEAVANGCTLRRFPVPVGVSASATRSIKESVDAGLNAMIDAHLKAVEEFDVTTRAGTMERMAEAVKTTRFKIEAYAEYLGDAQRGLLQRVEAAKLILRQKVMDVAGTTQAVDAHTQPEPYAAAA